MAGAKPRASNTPLLSKSRFQYGLQCLKRLYLECYRRELADPVPPGLQAIFDRGVAVGELARQRFPGGLLVGETHFEHDRAVETTKSLLTQTEIPAIYEAAFTFEGIRTRVDILKGSGPSAFDLVEVKSATSVKPEHISDVAIQLYVVEGSGVPVSRAYLMHLNRGYTQQGGNLDMERQFTFQDVTDAARSFIAERAADELARMWAALQQQNAPDIETGPHCNIPYRCAFYGHCHGSKADGKIQR